MPANKTVLKFLGRPVLAATAGLCLVALPAAQARPLGYPGENGLPKSFADLIEQLKAYGKVQRGFFGASLRTAEMTWENENGMFNSGATVESLVAGGPAQMSGIQIEDVIMNINGSGVMTSVEATRVIGKLRAGQVVPFEVLRGNNSQPMTVNVTLGARPEKTQVDAFLGVETSGSTDSPPTAPDNATGLGLVDLSANFRNSIGMRSDQVGVYVDTVAPGSAAARKGLKSGMVVLQFDQKDVPSVAMFESLLAKAKRARKDSVLLEIRTINGSENFVGLPI